MSQRLVIIGVCGLALAAVIGMQEGCRRDRPATRRPAAATLEFRILAWQDPANPEHPTSRNAESGRSAQGYFDLLKMEGPTTRPSGPYRWFKIANPDPKSFPDPPYVIAEHGGAKYVLAYDTPDKVLLRTTEGWWVQQVSPGRDSMNRPAIDFRLGGSGPAKFGKLTGGNIGRPLAILIDDQVVSAATIRSAISDRGQITGRFTQQYVNDLVNKLSAGEGE